MKIVVYIRPDTKGAITLRVDTKWESADTPTIQRYGMKLAAAIEGTGEPQ